MKPHRPRVLIGMFVLLALFVVAFQGITPPSRRVVLAQRPTMDLAQELTTTYPFYQDAAIAKAVAYLQTQQLENGAIDSFTFGADPGGTIRTILTLNAAGYPVNTLVSSTGNTLLDYLEAEVVNYIYQDDTPATERLFPGRAGQLLAAVAAAGADPAGFNGVDLIGALNAAYAAAGDGTYSTPAKEGFSSGAASDLNQTLAILGLVSAGQPIPVEATDWLVNNQNEDGSWSNDLSTTGYAIVALIGSGNLPPNHPAIQNGLAFYRANQTSTTALWGDTGSGEPANSTGWAMTALSTAGFIPTMQSWATGGTNPREALIGLQNDEGVIAARFFNAYATLEALYGLTDQPLFMATPLRVKRALAWLSEQQNSDGSWNGFSGNPSAGATIESVLAFSTSGYDPASVVQGGGASAIAYLESVAESYTNPGGTVSPGATGKLTLGVVASGRDATSFGTPPINLVDRLLSTYDSSTGAFTGAGDVINHAFAMLGVAVAAPATDLGPAANALVALQNSDGGWPGFGGDSSPDSTGIALQALIAAGIPASNASVQQGITYLRDSQITTGGWASSGGFSTNSTAYAIQGLLAANVDLTADAWLKNGRSPLGTLGSYQKPDGPFVANWDYASISEFYNPTADNLLATQQAVPALKGVTYPVTPTMALASFSPIKRGPDPDRLVAGAAFGTFNTNGQSITVTVPYGSDLNGNGEVTLEWSVAEDGLQVAAFEAVATTRETGFFSATIDLTGRAVSPTDTLNFRVTFRDSTDGVQNGGTFTTDPSVVESTQEPLRLYLPFIGS